jgi:hypothetical protein
MVSSLLPLITTMLSFQLGYSQTYFKLVKGDSYCEITDNGKCFQSKGYDETRKYSTYAECTIQVERTTQLKSIGFDLAGSGSTSSSCVDDYLLVDGDRYCGTSGPSKYLFASSIYYMKKSSVQQYKGFRICEAGCNSCGATASNSNSGNSQSCLSFTESRCTNMDKDLNKNNTCSSNGPCSSLDCCEDRVIDTRLPKDLGSTMITVALIFGLVVIALWLFCLKCLSGSKQSHYPTQPTKGLTMA